MNPSSAGGSVHPMPRRSDRMARPHDYLLQAAGAHSRLAEGVAHPADSSATTDATAEPTTGQRRARAQRRDNEGKFA